MLRIVSLLSRSFAALASLATLAAGLWVFRRLSPWFEDLL